MKDTKRSGDITVAFITGILLQEGHTVLVPVGDNSRYDLAIDCGGGTIERIQAKTGWLEDGVVHFQACSNHYHRSGGSRNYRGACESFAVYCPDTGWIYKVPVDKAPKSEGYLRVDSPKNNQARKIVWAKDFEWVKLAIQANGNFSKLGCQKSECEGTENRTVQPV